MMAFMERSYAKAKRSAIILAWHGSAGKAGRAVARQNPAVGRHHL
jgi:hypothetical protein